MAYKVVYIQQTQSIDPPIFEVYACDGICADNVVSALGYSDKVESSDFIEEVPEGTCCEDCGQQLDFA